MSACTCGHRQVVKCASHNHKTLTAKIHCCFGGEAMFAHAPAPSSVCGSKCTHCTGGLKQRFKSSQHDCATASAWHTGSYASHKPDTSNLLRQEDISGPRGPVVLGSARSRRSLIMSTWPLTARPTRHVRPMISPRLFFIALMRCNVPSIPALLSRPKAPS